MLRGYPRPQLRRDHWQSLNGTWDFALDPAATWQVPRDVPFERTIVVPFAPETTGSGIGHTGFFRAAWYRRTFAAPHLASGERLFLHFGAVDYQATVWVNGVLAAMHEGGFTPFCADITPLLGEGPQEIVVRAHDDPAELSKPRGKQDWQLEAHSIWYPRTSGIWQTVWVEKVPSCAIRGLIWEASLERWEIAINARFDGDCDDVRLGVRLSVADLVLADDVYSVSAHEVHRRIALSDPGIDDSRNELLWSPESPTLVHAELKLLGRSGDVVDRVSSYTALRSISLQGDRFLLNGRPYPLRLVLDQGYWPETGLTAPDDSALRKDVELAKAMGFNGVRKHQKVEDPRYLFWADHLGLVVWAEMPSAYRFTKASVRRLTREWTDVIERDASHPCIVAWVPFNESWGVPNLPDSPAEQDYVRALYHLTKTLDPTRLVVGNDGWESVATDLIGVHDYDTDLQRIAVRYHAHDVLPRLLRRERPGGRMLVVDNAQPHADHPIVLSEFGGIALDDASGRTWGYSRARSSADLARRYRALLDVVRSLELITGFCYTQFADTYQEANGLLFADRTPKFPIEEMAAATKGRHRPPESTVETPRLDVLDDALQ